MLQQPPSRPFDQQQLRSRLPKFKLAFHLSFFSVVAIVWIERLCLPSDVQILGQSPRLKDRFDFRNEHRDFLTKVRIGFGSFEKVDELLADQIG